MSYTYIPRSLEPIIQKAAREFPAVVLVGPRQSGKTTLLKHLFSERYKFISLEPPDVRLAALNDPRGFLNLYPPPVVLDEIQYAPTLLPYIKEQIDTDRSRSGQYILTGSQNLLLMQQVTESLAGRAAILKLLPLSRWEIAGMPERKLPWERSSAEYSPPPACLPNRQQNYGHRCCAASTRRLPFRQNEMLVCGRPVTSRPTWNAMCATCAISAI